MNNSPSTQERVWAVFGHLSALAFGMGLLIPVLGWSEQRRKSKYAAFQMLQALGYQSLGYTVWVLLALVVVTTHVLFTLSELLDAAESGGDIDQMLSLVMGGHFVAMMILIGLYIVLPISGAVSCAMGREFRYPILGRRLAGYAGYDSADEWLIEDPEDRFVAAMGHFAVIILVWGMLAPLTAWILQGKRSLFLRFQSVQTLVYQAFATLLFLGSVVVYVFGAAVLLTTVGMSGEGALNSTALIGLAVFGLSMLCMVAIVLIVPLLHILGQWAGYKILKGDDYRYPIVGKLVEKRMDKQTL